MSRPLTILLFALILAAAGLTGCGLGDQEDPGGPELVLEGSEDAETGEAPPPTFPNTATPNTVRVAGRNPIEDAAGVASLVFPATSAATRPGAVALVDARNWQGGVAAGLLMSGQIGAPTLLTEGGELPAVTAGTLARLDPAGVDLAEGAQVIRVGDEVARPEDRRTAVIPGNDPFELAANIDRFHATAEGERSENVIVVSAEEPGFALPAAAWAARSGDAVLFTERDAVPAVTREAIEAHERPNIYVLGPEPAVSEEVVEDLGELGPVERIEGPTPVENAVEFARYDDEGFGWGLLTPGHNYTLATTERALDAVAAAPLATSGTFAPLLLTDNPTGLPPPLEGYLLDVQPGFEENPNRGVFNRMWILGDQDAVSLTMQSRIDDLTELVPVQTEPPDDGGGGTDGGGGGGDQGGGGGGQGGGGGDLPGPDLPDDPGGIPAPRGQGLPGGDQ